MRLNELDELKFLLADSLSGLLGHLNRTEPSLVLLVTPMHSLLRQVQNMCCDQRAVYQFSL